MNQAKNSMVADAVRKGLDLLGTEGERIRSIADLSAHYKAPYLYAVAGKPEMAAYYASLMTKHYQQTDGDFRTTSREKGWYHLPASPANRYIYSNGWIIMGLRKLGCFGPADAAIGFVRGFQDADLGGFYSRFDPVHGLIDTDYIDSSSTSAGGLALLSCGHVEDARRAGDFLLKLLRAQPEPNENFYTSWHRKTGLMTDVWRAEEDPNSVRGRKQYCLTSRTTSLEEMTWLIGKPMKFLSKLYDQTRVPTYLDAAQSLFDFFHRLDSERWHTLTSCKVMWASAELFRLTHLAHFSETADRIMTSICEQQDPSGTWVNRLFYDSPTEQPIEAQLDVVQEMCAELLDTAFDLNHG